MRPTASDAQQELYEIVDSEASFEEKATEALELGRRFLGADNGHLTRIDRATEHWEVVASTDPPDGDFPPGLELDLSETYCRVTIEGEGSVALHDAPNQGWADDPAYARHGLDCYHGTPLMHDGTPYGTVCFVADDARKEAFSEEEMAFIEHLARELQHAFDHEHLMENLSRKRNLTNVLARVLRHNLRNDIGVIRGRVRLMQEEPDVDAHGEIALRTIDDIIDMVEKARKLDDVVGDRDERQVVHLGRLAETVVDEIRDRFPSASFTVHQDDADLVMSVDPSFEIALDELIENAAKHGGETPTVDVTVEQAPGGVDVAVTDDGPGLPRQEQQVLKARAETSLAHGSGLGLWLVLWIVSDHDGAVDTTASDEGTTVTLSIPRSSQVAHDRHQGALERHQSIYHAIFEGAFDGMVVVDEDMHIVETNRRAAEIYGMSERELTGRPIAAFLPEDFDLAGEWDRFERQKRVAGRVTIHGADGVERPIEYTASNGIAPNQHLVIMREVSEDGEVVESPTT